MGTWVPEPNGNGNGGKWRVEVLSEDQTGKNLNEVKRLVFFFRLLSFLREEGVLFA